MKRILAFVLAFVLVFSLCAVAGAATDPDPKPGTEVKSPAKGDKDREHFPYIPYIPYIPHSDSGADAPAAGNQNNVWGPTYNPPKTTIIVKFSNNTTTVGNIATEPYGADVEAARSLASLAVKDVDSAITELQEADPAAADTLKEFFETNGDNIGQGVITIPEGSTVNGAPAKLAVQARGVGIVVFEAPGDAANLGYIVMP